MGIRDRDYMRRPSDDDGEQRSSSDSKVEEFLSTFFQKHPRFFLYAGIALGALVVIGLLVAKLSGANH